MSQGHFLSIQRLCASRQRHTRERRCPVSHLRPLPTTPTALRVWMSPLVPSLVRRKSGTQRGEATCPVSPARGPCPENKGGSLHGPAAASPSDAGPRSGRLRVPAVAVPPQGVSPGDEGGHHPGLQPLHRPPPPGCSGPPEPPSALHELTSACEPGVLGAERSLLTFPVSGAQVSFTDRSHWVKAAATKNAI